MRPTSRYILIRCYEWCKLFKYLFYLYFGRKYYKLKWGGSMDKNTTLQELKEMVFNFDDKRDWHQYHHPKELAISISLEANELLENFQWKEKQSIKLIKDDDRLMGDLKDELADVVIYCLNFAIQLDIDVSSAIKEKIKKNENKYPIDLAKGSSEKYIIYQNGGK